MKSRSNFDINISDNLEVKDYKIILSKSDDDLFDEEKNIAEQSIRVKRISSGKNEKWRIYEDNKVALTIEGSKISKKDKEYLRTTDGLNFLIRQFKSGVKTINKMKLALKEMF